MKIRHAVPLLLTSVAGVFFFYSQIATSVDFFARDPGVRDGGADAGGPLSGLTANQRAFFDQGLEEFNSVEDVADGLGPTMNLDACGGCHAQPAAGGTSPKVNPQVAFATLRGADNKLPAFVRLNGPVREARFVKNADGSPDGGVHAIFTIQGRDDAPGCVLAQPDFATQLANRNVIFRIPTPVFGAGLIEQIPTPRSSSTARAIRRRNRRSASCGRPNRNGNDGTISRFGWKAQNQSLLIFSGEAYNVEMGITNELFQSERDETPALPVRHGPERRAEHRRGRQRRDSPGPAAIGGYELRQLPALPRSAEAGPRHPRRLDLDQPRQAACSRASAARSATRPR